MSLFSIIFEMIKLFILIFFKEKQVFGYVLVVKRLIKSHWAKLAHRRIIKHHLFVAAAWSDILPLIQWQLDILRLKNLNAFSGHSDEVKLFSYLHFPAHFVFPLLCNRSIDEQQSVGEMINENRNIIHKYPHHINQALPGPFLIFITHDDIFLIGC